MHLRPSRRCKVADAMAVSLASTSVAMLEATFSAVVSVVSVAVVSGGWLAAVSVLRWMERRKEIE